jgi:hypothetical protein
MPTARRGVIPVAVVLVGVAAAAIAALPPRSPVRFTRVTSGAAATDRASTGGVAWIDIDGDGDLDLFVTNGYDVSKRPSTPQTDRLYLNDGRGNLTPAPPGPLNSDTAYSSGQAWGDYDNDGDPDVLVATQLNRPDILYRNEGRGVFSAVVEGPLVTTPGSTFGASWADVDNDGNLDLLSVNGGLSGRGINALFRNLGGGSFERILEGHLVTDSTGHAGSAWGDYDNDGDLDLYVGNTVFAQPTSHLYRNDGSFRLTRITDSPVVTDSGPTLGGAWGDYDNDGDLDLFTANWGAPSVLYTNVGNGRFDRFDHGDLGRLITTAGSTSWGDIDGDGDLDVIVGTWPNYPGPLEEDHIYRNESPARGWLGVRLVGTRSNRSGIGARVTVRARIGGRRVTQMRELVPTTSFRSHDPLELHFGLDDANRVDEIVVRWPSGIVQRLGAQRARQRITITETGR